MSDRLANINGFAPTTFKSVRHFDFSSVERDDLKVGIQVFSFLVVNIICSLVISRTFLLMSECDSPYIEPSRWAVNHCYNHKASFSQPCLFVFALPDDLFKDLRRNPQDLRRPTFRILVIQSLFTVDFHRFTIFFTC